MTNKQTHWQTNRQTPLKTSTSLCYAMLVGNYRARTVFIQRLVHAQTVASRCAGATWLNVLSNILTTQLYRNTVVFIKCVVAKFHSYPVLVFIFYQLLKLADHLVLDLVLITSLKSYVCQYVIVADPGAELVQSWCIVSSEHRNRSVTLSLLQWCSAAELLWNRTQANHRF